jgi:hypothetical protein
MVDWHKVRQVLVNELITRPKYSLGYNIDQIERYYHKGQLYVMHYAGSDEIMGFYAMRPLENPADGNIIIYMQSFTPYRGDGSAMLHHIEQEIVRKGGNKVEADIIPRQSSFWEHQRFMFESNPSSSTIMFKDLCGQAGVKTRTKRAGGFGNYSEGVMWL